MFTKFFIVSFYKNLVVVVISITTQRLIARTTLQTPGISRSTPKDSDGVPWIVYRN